MNFIHSSVSLKTATFWFAGDSVTCVRTKAEHEWIFTKQERRQMSIIQPKRLNDMFYASAAEGVSETLSSRVVRPSVRPCVCACVGPSKSPASMISYKPKDRISLNFGWWWGERRRSLVQNFPHLLNGLNDHNQIWVCNRVWCVDDTFLSSRSCGPKVKVRPRSRVKFVISRYLQNGVTDFDKITYYNNIIT